MDIYSLAATTPTNLSHDLIHYLTDYGNGESFKAGDIIVKEGNPSDAVYIILDGIAKVIKSDDFGNNNVIATADKGTIFGEMGVFLDSVRSGTIIAQTDLKALKLSNENFVNALLNFPDLAARLYKSLCTRLNQVNGALVNLINNKLMTLVGTCLIELSEEAQRVDDTIIFDIEKIKTATQLETSNILTAIANYKKLGVIKEANMKSGDNEIVMRLNLDALKERLRSILLTLNPQDHTN